ncbi:MAG: helix-hairpin-helix domain-containing protein [Actinomycetes bacterium]|jgi:DNA polymerase (family 10)|nr:MAG: DNA polymerase/3'-5' exonuclease PolX [Actinomycetota bacterium]
MVRANDAVAAALQEYAELFALDGGDAFRVRSYQRAAKAIAGHPEEITAENVRAVPGVGEAIARKVEEFLRRGAFRQLDELRARVPEGVRRLVRVPSLGPKTALVLYHEYGIGSPEELAEAIRAGRLTGRKGFGPKTLANLLSGVERLLEAGSRTHLGVATGLAERVAAALRAAPGAGRVAVAGALRRGVETIAEVELLATAADPAALVAVLRGLPYLAEVAEEGPGIVAARAADGPRVRLHLTAAEAWGAALLAATGSAAHLARLRALAAGRGRTLTERGLFDGERRVAGATEEEVYAALGLPWVPPELREDAGEVEAALRGELPRLVTLEDLRGDLHTHTDLTDGVASLEEMAAAAAGRGHAYYAVTDHAPDLVMQRMTLEKALAQRERLRRLQAAHPGMRLLHGTELNIGPDGSVDWPAEVLAGFDVCVASVHSHFTQSPKELTRRLVAACENPGVHVIGHPTTRKIGKRPPIEPDWDTVFAAAARTGTAMEIDSYPDRADLPSDLVRLARRHGVKFAIDSDAHAVPHLAYQRFGVGIARRAGLTPDDVINCWPLERLLEFLRSG